MLEKRTGASLVVQLLRLGTPNLSGGPGSALVNELRICMETKRSHCHKTKDLCMLQLLNSKESQINIKKKKKKKKNKRKEARDGLRWFYLSIPFFSQGQANRLVSERAS